MFAVRLNIADSQILDGDAMYFFLTLVKNSKFSADTWRKFKFQNSNVKSNFK